MTRICEAPKCHQTPTHAALVKDEWTGEHRNMFLCGACIRAAPVVKTVTLPWPLVR